MADSDLLQLGVTLDEFFGAAAGEGDGEAAVVFVAFNADDGADAVFGMAHLLTDQRIGAGAAPCGAAEGRLAARAGCQRLAHRGSVAAANPTQNGPSGRAATVARMSTVGFSVIVSGAPDFLSLRGEGASGV